MFFNANFLFIYLNEQLPRVSRPRLMPPLVWLSWSLGASSMNSIEDSLQTEHPEQIFNKFSS